MIPCPALTGGAFSISILFVTFKLQYQIGQLEKRESESIY